MLSSVSIVIVNFGFTCYSAAMLPFVTDQVIGATSDELSTVVRWYYWTQYVGIGFSYIPIYSYTITENLYIISTLFFAIPLAVIIISDSMCQQWLDRTHKVTNPIKLSSYRYSTTLGSTATQRDAVPSPILTRNSPHEWTMARKNSEDPSLRRR